MERIVHILGIHASDEEAHRLHHNDGVRRLDGYHHVVEIMFTEDAQKLHTALHYALWGIAIAITYAVGQRAVVYSYAHCGMVLTADIDEGDKTLFDLDNLVSIFLVGVFNLLECACGIDIVAWIYSHGVAMEGSHVGDIGIEVHVGDDRCRISSRL